MTERPDEKHWWAHIDEDGTVLYYDADIAASAHVQEIMIRAQVNQTELGYWRDVAIDLAALVDKLELELQDSMKLNKRFQAALVEDIKVFYAGPPNMLACRKCLYETSGPHAFVARIGGLCFKHIGSALAKIADALLSAEWGYENICPVCTEPREDGHASTCKLVTAIGQLNQLLGN